MRIKMRLSNKKVLTVIISLILTLVFGFLFYYYIYKPDQIKKSCNKQAKEEAIEQKSGVFDKEQKYEIFSEDEYNRVYKECLIFNNLPQ